MTWEDRSRAEKSICPSFADLVGKTIVDVEMSKGDGDDRIDFTLSTGETFRLYHEQDCCEGVNIADVNGDLAKLRGEVKLAEESTNSEDDPPEYPDSWTWTFYRIATDAEHVDIRWLGESNGYYSESVDWMLVA